ncbi:MAG: alpha/beta fold hydrolase [Planctomycetota bacterium]
MAACAATIQPARPDLLGEAPRRETLRLRDGCEVDLFVHRPAEPSRLPVVYLHGIQSHPGWFFASASALARRGHPVFQPTRRGSGHASAPRGHARSCGQLLDDVATVCATARERTGASGVHLVGVSWGGKLAAAYAAGGKPQPASVTLIAPGIASQVDVGPATKLAVAACLLVRPRRGFAIPLNDPALFTDDEAMRDYIRRDPCRLHRATARFLYVSRILDRRLRRTAAGAIRSPTTLILARRDRIIDNDRTAAAVARLTDGLAVTVELDGAHTLEFEPDPSPLHDALAAAVRWGEGAASPR